MVKRSPKCSDKSPNVHVSDSSAHLFVKEPETDESNLEMSALGPRIGSNSISANGNRSKSPKQRGNTLLSAGRGNSTTNERTSKSPKTSGVQHKIISKQRPSRKQSQQMFLNWATPKNGPLLETSKKVGLHTPTSRLRRDPSRQTVSTVGKMCGGIVQTGICHFTELTPGQFGLTKQLVLRITLPHISLLLISIGYALAGCWILTAINYKTDSLEAEQLIEEAKTKYASRLVERLLKRPQLDEFLEDRSDFEHFSSNLYDVYARFPRSTAVLDNVGSGDHHSYTKGPLTNVTWNLFFVATTLTSIGYGTNAPDSLVGRLFCILYISAGIPLYLITMADLAKFCTEFMNRSYTEYLKLKHHLKMRWKRWRRRDLRRRSKQITKEVVDDATGSESLDIDHVIIAGGEEEVAEFLWTHLENTQFVEIPFLLIYVILLTYIGASSYLIAYLEEWPTIHGFYFVMMSVLTIGFGDVMPSKDKHVITILLLILTGLIITTTCVDIVGAYYIDQLHFFGRRLDIEDPLLWLKAVQQKRIDAMKREAMRKLFETVAALNRMQFDPKMETKVPLITSTENVKIIELPDPPRNLLAYNATAQSVCLRWEAPIFVDEGKRYWYTISYKTRTPQRKNTVTVIDFVNTTSYEVKNLKSFTLYEFSVLTTTRFGSSVAVRAQEYTEPCTVPQSVRLEALSTETATISWRTPRKNNGPESYVLLFSQEPAPQFRYWRRYRVGKTLRFTLTGLNPDTRYICCVLAEHNFGLAAMSKSIRFCTRTWWFDNEEDEEDLNVNSPSFQSGEPSPLFGQLFTGGSTEKIQTPTIVPPEVQRERRRSSAATNPNGRRRSSRRELTEDEKEHLLAIAGRTPTPTAMWKPKPINTIDLDLFLRPTNTNPEVLASQAQFAVSPMRLHPPSLLAPSSPKKKESVSKKPNDDGASTSKT